MRYLNKDVRKSKSYIWWLTWVISPLFWGIVISLILTKCVFGQEYLISDYDFTNQDYTFQKVVKFCNSYKNCQLNYSDIEKIVRHCHIYTINPVLVLAKMQMESDLIYRNMTNKPVSYLKYRAMAYGMAKHFDRDGKRFCVYGGYDLQVYHAIRTFRKHFDEWTPNTKKEILDLKQEIITKNASTYALYRYTPFYDEHNTYNWEYSAMGNKQFVEMFEKFKKKWNEL